MLNSSRLYCSSCRNCNRVCKQNPKQQQKTMESKVVTSLTSIVELCPYTPQLFEAIYHFKSRKLFDGILIEAARTAFVCWLWWVMAFDLSARWWWWCPLSCWKRVNLVFIASWSYIAHCSFTRWWFDRFHIIYQNASKILNCHFVRYC